MTLDSPRGLFGPYVTSTKSASSTSSTTQSGALFKKNKGKANPKKSFNQSSSLPAYKNLSKDPNAPVDYSGLSPKLRSMSRQEDQQARNEEKSREDYKLLHDQYGVKVDAKGVPVYDKNGNMQLDPQAFKGHAHQTGVGDCFLVATMESMKESSKIGPEGLAKMVTPVVKFGNRDPQVSYNVKFGNGHTVNVTSKELGHGYETNHVQGDSNRTLNPSVMNVLDTSAVGTALGQRILEGAYGKYKGSDSSNVTSAINHGGDPSQVYRTFTGQPSYLTHGRDENKKSLEYANTHPTDNSYVIDSKAKPNDSRFVGGHAYSLIIDPQTGQKEAVNPWDPNTLRIPVSDQDILNNFDFVHINNKMSYLPLLLMGIGNY